MSNNLRAVIKRNRAFEEMLEKMQEQGLLKGIFARDLKKKLFNLQDFEELSINGLYSQNLNQMLGEAMKMGFDCTIVGNDNLHFRVPIPEEGQKMSEVQRILCEFNWILDNQRRLDTQVYDMECKRIFISMQLGDFFYLEEKNGNIHIAVPSRLYVKDEKNKKKVEIFFKRFGIQFLSSSSIGWEFLV